MKVVALLTELGAIDRIVSHLELTGVGEEPPPGHAFEQIALMAAEKSGESELRHLRSGIEPDLLWPLPG
jgi:hypothetical protein